VFFSSQSNGCNNNSSNQQIIIDLPSYQVIRHPLYNTFMRFHWQSANLILILMLLSGCSVLSPQFETTQPSNTPLVSTETSLPTISPTQTIEPLPVAPGEIWIVNQTDNMLLCYDAQTLAQITSIPVQGEITALAQGKFGVWAIDKTNRKVVHIDPQTHQITQNIALSGFIPFSLAISDQGIWVGVQPEATPSPENPGSYPGGGLFLIDPDSGSIKSAIELNAPATDIEVYGGWIWAIASGNGFSSLYLIDPKNMTPYQPTQGATWYDHASIAVNTSGVWLINSMIENTLIHLDIQNNWAQTQISLEGLKGSSYEIAATDSSVWVISDKGDVARINAKTKEVVAIFPVSSREAELFTTDDMVWVVSAWDGLIYAISPDQNKVIVFVTTGNRKPTPTRTPTITPYPTESPMPPCTAAYTTRLKVGARAIVESEPALPNRIRAEPGLGGKVMGFIQQYETVLIIGGPVCRDDWVWWKVRSEQSYIVGWTAEGDKETYWLQPLE
jgi:DNA-binding beta-propeller fold protein YncE